MLRELILTNAEGRKVLVNFVSYTYVETMNGEYTKIHFSGDYVIVKETREDIARKLAAIDQRPERDL